MMAGIAALRSVAQAVRQLSKVPSAAAREASKSIETLVQQEFDAGVDPYGKAWEALSDETIRHGRGEPPLTDTGALRDVEVGPMPGAGVSVVLGEEYGSFHQIGTKNMPAREPLPSHGLPDTWRRAIADAVDEAFEKAVP